MKVTFTRLKTGILGMLLFAALTVGHLVAADRPNFLWILSEDNSKHFLKIFDPTGAPTPRIEQLAAQGLAFDQAFSCSPVCSVARTTLMSGVYAPRLGTHYHRRIVPARLPNGWHLFPAYLRQAGYYTSNNAKTDYNTANHEGTWDDSSRRASWRNRPQSDVPFFHMQTFTTTHEGSLHFSRETMASEKTLTDPNMVALADYHPDTPLFRYTYARYHDRQQEVDRQIGQLIDQLAEDGLLDNTWIFYFGDHGGVLPGSKGYLRETGLHIPLVVRIPEQWKDRSVDGPGSRVSGFVNFVDFGPTVLHLAGVPVPPHMDGRPFLGDGITRASLEDRQEAFGYADRFDEKYEMVRSLRQGKFKYVRYFQSYYPDGLQNNYRYQMLAYQQWRDLYREGRLDPVRAAFFQPKPAEALFDVEEDPYETRNLAVTPEHRDTLLRLRERLSQWMTTLPDLSFFPENEIAEQACPDPLGFARDHAQEIVRLAQVADLALIPLEQAQPSLEKTLRETNAWLRSWALTVCTQFGDAARPLVDAARPCLSDPNPVVRLRAAEFLGTIGDIDPRAVLREILRTEDSAITALLTLNTAVYFQDGPLRLPFPISPADVKSRHPEVDRRLEYLAPPGARRR